MPFGNNSNGCWLVYGGGFLMPRQYIVKMIGNVQTVSLMQVEVLYRWLIQQFNYIMLSLVSIETDCVISETML